MRETVRVMKRAGLFLSVLLFASFIIVPSALAAVTITEYDVTTANSQPHGITVGPDGNIWFTEFNAGQIGVMSPSGTVLHEYPIATANSKPNSIVLGPDGNLWFTEYGASKVGVMSPAGAVLAEYTTASGPHEIIAGPDGNLWFTDIGNGKIGQVTTGGTVTFFPSSTTLDTPYGITVGPDNNIWFTEFGNGEIGQMNTSGVVLNDYPLPITPAARAPYDITTGGDGNLWFTGENGRISRMTPAGALTEFTTPSGTSTDPHGIVTGPDGNVWFTERNAAGNRIGMVKPDGTITEYSIPTTDSGPFIIAKGPNNTIWFSESNTNKLGVLSGIIAPATAPAGSSSPKAPDTGFGVYRANPLLTLLMYSIVTTGLLGLAYVLIRRQSKSHL